VDTGSNPSADADRKRNKKKSRTIRKGKSACHLERIKFIDTFGQMKEVVKITNFLFPLILFVEKFCKKLFQLYLINQDALLQKRAFFSFFKENFTPGGGNGCKKCRKAQRIALIYSK
jgi:hypothetical protein